MRTLFATYSGDLLCLPNPDDLSKFMNIIEEYILAGLIVFDDYANIIKIIEDTYELTLKASPLIEEVFNLKCALLSLMSTLFLIFSRQNATDTLKIFEKLLIYLLKDLFNDFYDPQMKSSRSFRVAITTLINRFIIINPNEFLLLLASNNYLLILINFYQISKLVLKAFCHFGRIIWDFWYQIRLGNSFKYYLTVNIFRRINSVAVSQFLPFIKNRQLLANHLEEFLRATVPELGISLKDGDKLPILNDQKGIEGE